MKLATYQYNNVISVGAVTENGICPAPEIYNGNDGIIRFFQAGAIAINELAEKINIESELLSIDDVQLLAPVIKPNKFFGVSLNYADHIKETGLEQPEYPTYFNKQNSCV